MDSTSTAVVGIACAAAYFLDKAVAVQNELLAALAAACLFVYVGNRIVLFSEEPDEQDDEHETDSDNSGTDEDEEREDNKNSGADENEDQADDEREDDVVESTRLNVADGIEPEAGADEWNYGREILDALAEEEYDVALSLLGELATGSLAVVAPYVTDKNHSLGCRLRGSQHDELVEEGERVLGVVGMQCCPCRYGGSIGIVSFVDSDMNLREKEETKLSSHDVDMLLATE